MVILQCPICKATNSIGSIKPLLGSTSFAIFAVNHNANPTSKNALLVDLKGCTSCGFIFVESPSIIDREMKIR